MCEVLQDLEAMSQRLSALKQSRVQTATASNDQRTQALRETDSTAQLRAEFVPPTAKIRPEERARCVSEGSDHDPVATADVVEVLGELEHMESVLTDEKESKARIIDVYEDQLREKSLAHARDVAMLEQMLQAANAERARLMAKAAKLQPSEGKKFRANKDEAASPSSTRSNASEELDSTAGTVSSVASRGPIVPRLVSGKDLDSTLTSESTRSDASGHTRSRSTDEELGLPQQKVLSGASSDCAETGSTTSDRPHLEQHMLEL